VVALSFKRQFVPAIREGLGLAPLPGFDGADWIVPKCHTIREGSVDGAGAARSPKGQVRARVGVELQLYYAQRTKHVQLIGRARCSSIESILIMVDTMAITLSGKLLTPQARAHFAASDGFATVGEMQYFWRTEHAGVRKFEGVVIHWEPWP
jgi:hypothetical protein